MNSYQVKKKFSEVVNDFISFIENKKLIIHNAEFDLSHLNNELLLVGKKKIEKTNVIDTLELARNKFPGSQISLDALCRRFRIDNSKRTQHTALIDCELLAKVYVNLIDQKEPHLDFSTKNDVEIIKKNNVQFTRYSKKIIKPTSEEIQLHKVFLKNELKKNFFN